MAVLARPYRPRRPQDTLLHRVVREHLETFFEYARETYDAPIPKYVRDELRGYLRCGIFQHGFLRMRCEQCDHDLLVAFSCKARGLCPSCAGRRMASTAAHVVDRIIPAVPVRQWVLSLPFDVRAAAAYDAGLLSAVVRAFAKALRDRHRRFARAAGFAAITFVQRFGSSLNLNVHLHVVVVDGVFSRDPTGALLFTPAPAPSAAEMLTAIRAVRPASRSSRPPSRSLRLSPPAPSWPSRAASSAPSPRPSMAKASRRSSRAAKAPQSTKAATTSKRASASTPTATSHASTYFDIVPARPSLSAASSHYR